MERERRGDGVIREYNHPDLMVERPMWCDGFDADLPKVVPAARAALGPVGDLMLQTHAGLASNGMMSHPAVWNTDRGCAAIFWRPGRYAKPSSYYTRDPVVDLTLWEALRDAWVHTYVLLIENVPVFDAYDGHKHFEVLMWDVRDWQAPWRKDGEIEAARTGALKMVTRCRAIVEKHFGAPQP